MTETTTCPDASANFGATSGTLVLVVGPSGAGKDTLIGEARRQLASEPRVVFARRAITRPSGDPTEQHLAMTPSEFEICQARGDFLLSWPAHGLKYGIPSAYARDLQLGLVVVANVSRTVILDAEQRVSSVVVLHITAPVEMLAARIAVRGRERVEEIAERIRRQPPLSYARASFVEIVNDGSVEKGARLIMDLLTRLASR